MRKIVLFLMLIVLINGCAKLETPAAEQPETGEIPPVEVLPVVEEGQVPEMIEEPVIEPEIIEEPEPEEITEQIVEETIEEVTELVEVDPNLVAHWKFDDNAEDSAQDYDGTIKGDASFTAGKVGKAISLDGVDDYVELPQSAVNEISELSQGTIAFWFKFSSLLDKQTLMPIFYIGVDEKDPDNIYIIEIGHFDFMASDATPDPSNTKLYSTWIKDNKDPFLCYDSNANLAENKWYHFAAVISSKGNTGYLDGDEITNRNYNFGKSSDTYFLDDIQGEENLFIGYGRSSADISPDFVYYKGALDDFRVYNKALSGSEIKDIMEG